MFANQNTSMDLMGTPMFSKFFATACEAQLDSILDRNLS